MARGDVMAAAARLGCAISVAALAFALQPPAAFPAGAASQEPLTPLESRVVAELNAVRVRHGLLPLRVSRPLSRAASRHTIQMLDDGFFAHRSNGGLPFRGRLALYYPAAGYRYWSVGEIMLWSSAHLDAARAVAMWLASAPHRANLLKARWREIGIAAVAVPQAPGVFGHLDVTVITTDFGVRDK